MAEALAGDVPLALELPLPGLLAAGGIVVLEESPGCEGVELVVGLEPLLTKGVPFGATSGGVLATTLGESIGAATRGVPFGATGVVGVGVAGGTTPGGVEGVGVAGITTPGGVEGFGVAGGTTPGGVEGLGVAGGTAPGSVEGFGVAGGTAPGCVEGFGVAGGTAPGSVEGFGVAGGTAPGGVELEGTAVEGDRPVDGAATEGDDAGADDADDDEPPGGAAAAVRTWTVATAANPSSVAATVLRNLSMLLPLCPLLEAT